MGFIQIIANNPLGSNCTALHTHGYACSFLQAKASVTPWTTGKGATVLSWKLKPNRETTHNKRDDLSHTHTQTHKGHWSCFSCILCILDHRVPRKPPSRHFYRLCEIMNILLLPLRDRDCGRVMLHALPLQFRSRQIACGYRGGLTLAPQMNKAIWMQFYHRSPGNCSCCHKTAR